MQKRICRIGKDNINLLLSHNNTAVLEEKFPEVTNHDQLQGGTMELVGSQRAGCGVRESKPSGLWDRTSLCSQSHLSASHNSTHGCRFTLNIFAFISVDICVTVALTCSLACAGCPMSLLMSDFGNH